MGSDRIKASLQIGQDIVNVLCANGQADGVCVNTLLLQLPGGELRVGGGGRVDHQALDIRHISQQGEYLQMINEPKRFRLTTLDFKGKDRRTAAREIFFIQGMVGMIRQRGMVYMFHQRMAFQIVHHLFRVLSMALQPQGQCLHPLKQ